MLQNIFLFYFHLHFFQIIKLYQFLRYEKSFLKIVDFLDKIEFILMKVWGLASILQFLVLHKYR